MYNILMTARCTSCGEEFDYRRYLLGYRTCLECGEATAREVKHCIVPMHKSNYVLITDQKLLVGINNKATRNG
jgi:predicted  nucleic acid-binding Zn-ribbon protein